jgi:hypothetical protein
VTISVGAGIQAKMDQNDDYPMRDNDVHTNNDGTMFIVGYGSKGEYRASNARGSWDIVFIPFPPEQHLNRGILVLKDRLVPRGRKPLVIRGGLASGIKMNLDLTYQSQIWLGLIERELHPWFRRLSENIVTAVDVGADEGFYTLLFLLRTSAQRVFAFEPESEGRARLMDNLRLNGDHLDRVALSRKYVSSVDTDESCALDSLEIVPPCLIKVDVEGGEVDVLRGATKLLATRSVRWIVEVHSPTLREECESVLRAANLEVHDVKEATWRRALPELRPRQSGRPDRWLVAVS